MFRFQEASSLKLAAKRHKKKNPDKFRQGLELLLELLERFLELLELI